MPRLPMPGSDGDEWGILLNEFLRVAHQEDGTLRGIDILSTRPIGVKYVNGLIERQYASPGVEYEVLNVSGRGGGYIDFFQVVCRWYSLIRIYVDGESEPSIAVPANMFFAAAYGAVANDGEVFAAKWFACGQLSDDVTMEGTTWLPIPFTSSIRATLTHPAGTWVLADISCQTGLSNTWPLTRRLHIASRSFINVPHIDSLLTLVDDQGIGRGRLAGIYINVDSGPGNVSPPTAPLEGNFRIYVDGSANPSMGSSGVEDLFGMGFYFNKFQAPYPYGDRCLSLKRTNAWAGHRLFVQDPIGFTSGIRVTWQCGESASGRTYTGIVRFSYTVWYYTE